MAVAEKVIVELELKDQGYNARVKSSEREFKRSMDATERAAADTARDIERTMGQIPDSLRAKYRDLGTDIGRSFAGASRAAQIAFGAITAYSLNAARKAEDINDAFAFTFNEIGDDADKAADRIATAFNRTATSVKSNLSNSYQILTGLGLDSQRAFTGAQAIAERSIDLASQKGISDARAYEAIISGLTGETEPLKRLGVVLSEATVQAELLRMGFKGNASDASEAQKAVARYNIVMEKTATAQGDVARTADSANNKLKDAQTEFENAAVALGNELLPALVTVTGAATDLLKAFNDLPSGVQVAGLAFLGLIAAGGPIAGMIANLSRLRGIAIATGAAIAAMGAGGGAGAAAGGAAVGAGLARFGAVGVAAGGVLSLSGDTRQQGGSAGAQQALTQAQQQLVRARTTEERRAAQAQVDYFRAALNRLNRDSQASNAGSLFNAAINRQTESARAAANGGGVVSGFGLGGLPGGTVGGGTRGGGGGSSAVSEAARELDQLRSDLARIQQGQLNDAERAALDLAEKIAVIKRAVDGELLTPREAAILTGGVAGENLTNPRRDPLETIGVNGRDIRDQLREGRKETDDAFAERGRIAAQSFIDVVYSDDIWASLGNVFANAAGRNLENLLSTLFTAIFQNGGQGAGILNGIGSFLGFGGGRAMGGPVRKGFAYDVGESGRERFVAPANGFIMPNMGGSAMRGSGSQRIDVRQTFVLEGVTGDAAIYANVQRLVAQGQRQTLAIVRDQAGNVQTENRLLRE